MTVLHHPEPLLRLDDLARQVAPTLRIALWTALPTALVLIVVWVASAQLDIRISIFTRDPASLAHVPPYFGVFSHLGVLGWWTPVAICLFTARSVASRARAFLLASAALSALLCFDDLFMLHEEVFAVGLGVPQKLTYAVYMAMIAGYLILFRGYILAGDWGPLALALGVFALAVAVDVVFPPRIPIVTFLEDGAKLIGVSLWAGYLWNECRRALRGPHFLG
jgi:hypothetical protein